MLIPTYNDLEMLPEITTELRELNESYRVLVVDDGSTVAVDPAKLEPDTLLFRAPANFGLGAATHIAFDHALRHGYRAVVRLDADGQHPLEMIPELVKPIEQGEAELVVGARLNRNAGHGIRNVAGLLLRGYMSAVSRLMTGNRAPTDVNSGFFAISARAMATLNTIPLERYPEPQMYILAGRQRLPIKEVPIRQIARVHGSSTITLARALGMFYRFNVLVLGELLQRSATR